MSPPLICMESEFTRAFDQSLVVISSRWRRWRSDQQAAAVPPRLYSVLCTRLLYCCTALLHTGSHALILTLLDTLSSARAWGNIILLRAARRAILRDRTQGPVHGFGL